MNGKRPLVWAHRGASGYCPENTMPAFIKAIEIGAAGVELDVQMSKDGQLVVCHDEKIDRTSNGKGFIKDMSLSELKSFDFSYGSENYAGERIPTMREVFELYSDTDMYINIELKTGIVFYSGIEEKIIELTEEYGFTDRVIYSSFNHYTVKKIKELRPEARCGFLYADGTIDMPKYAKLHGIEALHPAVYNLQFPGFTDECSKQNIDVNVWTVNEDEDVKMCCEKGVNAIITNFPDRALSLIKNIMGKSNE